MLCLQQELKNGGGGEVGFAGSGPSFAAKAAALSG
jgi:hypothetical protein